MTSVVSFRRKETTDVDVMATSQLVFQLGDFVILLIQFEFSLVSVSMDEQELLKIYLATHTDYQGAGC